MATSEVIAYHATANGGVALIAATGGVTIVKTRVYRLREEGDLAFKYRVERERVEAAHRADQLSYVRPMPFRSRAFVAQEDF